MGAAMVGAAQTRTAEIDDYAIAAMALNACINNVVIDLVHDDFVGAEPRWDARSPDAASRSSWAIPAALICRNPASLSLRAIKYRPASNWKTALSARLLYGA
ncbi:MAG: hypothetical protein R3D05_13255 [Dongiaceae bacterium]